MPPDAENQVKERRRPRTIEPGGVRRTMSRLLANTLFFVAVAVCVWLLVGPGSFIRQLVP